VAKTLATIFYFLNHLLTCSIFKKNKTYNGCCCGCVIARPNCNSDEKDEGKRNTFVNMMYVGFETLLQNALSLLFLGGEVCIPSLCIWLDLLMLWSTVHRESSNLCVVSACLPGTGFVGYFHSESCPYAVRKPHGQTTCMCAVPQLS
jgi:hypothetical protein